MIHPWYELSGFFGRWCDWFDQRGWFVLAVLASYAEHLSNDRLCTATGAWLREHTRLRAATLDHQRQRQPARTWTQLAARFGDDLAMLQAMRTTGPAPEDVRQFVRQYVLDRTPGELRHRRTGCPVRTQRRRQSRVPRAPVPGT